jgi:hypothetical protein
MAGPQGNYRKSYELYLLGDFHGTADKHTITGPSFVSEEDTKGREGIDGCQTVSA